MKVANKYLVDIVAELTGLTQGEIDDLMLEYGVLHLKKEAVDTFCSNFEEQIFKSQHYWTYWRNVMASIDRHFINHVAASSPMELVITETGLELTFAPVDFKKSNIQQYKMLLANPQIVLGSKVIDYRWEQMVQRLIGGTVE